jgi:Na+(H+)/acetate symporter ActP
VDVSGVLADPRWVDDWPAGPLNPLASNVGWLNISNLACGVFGLAAGFLVMFLVSLLSRTPAAERLKVLQALRSPHDTGSS